MFEFKPGPTVVAAAAAALAVLMHLSALAFSDPPPTRQQWVRAGVEGLLAIAAGTMAAMFLAPSVAAWDLFGFRLDEHAASFLIGFAAWRLLPVAIHAAQSWLRRLGGLA